MSRGALLLLALAVGCAPWPTTARMGASCGQPGEPCCTNMQCGSGSFCSNGTCAQCPSGQILCGTRCIGSSERCGGQLDVLFVIDNSNSMSENQANLVRTIDPVVELLARPPGGGLGIEGLHLGVVSTDLGTPGSIVPSCANSDLGDDGLLNPIRYGRAIRAHQPWTTAPPGRRPARCTNDLNQYPPFLTYDPGMTPIGELRDDFVCNLYLSIGGCGLEQQLESAYRALVVHDARAREGNTDPNAGFVRDNAVLAIVMVTDEEDGSTRDCRYAEPGVPCTDALGVFDIMNAGWSSNDLNLRFYMYTPDSPQDPTWTLDRYIDPMRPGRGFPSVKRDHPERVVFAAITGVPLDIPMAPRGDGGTGVNWDRLLGAARDGSQGLEGAQGSAGTFSMRQRNMDPMCPTRVVPACRRQGSTAVTTCDPASQYFAWPSRRIAQVVRRFDERDGAGVIGSICRTDYLPVLTEIAGVVARRVAAITP